MIKKILFMLGMLCVVQTVFAQCKEPFFSEYIEGSSSNKALELFNPSDTAINLSDYRVYRFNNGSTFPTDSMGYPNEWLASHDVYVIGNPAANVTITGQTDTFHTMTFYNGDDAIMLKKISTNDTLDIIGQIGVDPGSGWVVGSGATNNNTLTRMSTIRQGQTNWAIGVGEWNVFPIDMDDSLGSHMDFIPCSLNIPLPVRYLNFFVHKQSNSNLVDWTTIMETNNSHFNVQRSSNAFDFESLGKVYSKAINGNSTSALDYAFEDDDPLSGHNYYRLEQVDKDGNKSYSELIKITRTESGIVSLYPNPTQNLLNVDYSSAVNGKTEIRLMDISGRIIKTKKASLKKGMKHFEISMSELASGVYHVQIIENERTKYYRKIRKE